MNNAFSYIVVPYTIQKALEMVQQLDPSAVVAGGCIRDTILGRDYHDIDICVGPSFKPLFCMDLHRTSEEVASMPHMFAPNIDCVYRTKIDYSYTQIDIVKYKDKLNFRYITDVIDLGFCQVTYNGKDIEYSELFASDIINNTATCTLAVDNPRMQRSKERAQKMKERWPTRRFLYPI